MAASLALFCDLSSRWGGLPGVKSYPTQIKGTDQRVRGTDVLGSSQSLCLRNAYH